MKIEDLPISKMAKHNLIELGYMDTAKCAENMYSVARTRFVGSKTLQVIYAQCLAEGLNSSYCPENTIANGASNMIIDAIESAKTIDDLFGINPEKIVADITKEKAFHSFRRRLGGNKSFRNICSLFRSKARELIDNLPSFDEKMRIWRLCTYKSITHGRPVNGPWFLRAEIAKYTIESALSCAKGDADKAIEVWNRVRRTPTGAKAVECAFRWAKTSEQYWQAAIIAHKNKDKKTWKACIKKLSMKR